MSTIKVQSVAVPMELEVSVTPDQIVQAFDSSVNDLITSRVNEAVPSALNNIIVSADYVRRVRGWIMESLDYSYVGEMAARQFTISEIVDELLDRSGENPLESSDFIDRITRTTRFAVTVERSVTSYLNSNDYVSAAIEEAIESKTANLANEIAERVLVIIGQRLSGGADV